MIRNDRELLAAQSQIAHMLRVLAEMRLIASSDEFRVVARSTRGIVERMQRDILDYLTKSDTACRSLAAAAGR